MINPWLWLFVILYQFFSFRSGHKFSILIFAFQWQILLTRALKYIAPKSCHKGNSVAISKAWQIWNNKINQSVLPGFACSFKNLYFFYLSLFIPLIIIISILSRLCYHILFISFIPLSVYSFNPKLSISFIPSVLYSIYSIWPSSFH